MSLLPVRRTAAALGVVVLASTLSAAPAYADTTTAPAVTARAAVLPAAARAANARIRKVLPVRVGATKPLGRNRAVQVIDAASGAGIYGTRGSVPMRGASVTKLATAVASLQLLGTTTRFPTKVVTGRTNREVVLVGGGDPLLTSAQLRNLARDTAAALLSTLPAPAPVVTPSATPTDTPSGSPSASPSVSASASATATGTATPSAPPTTSPSPTPPAAPPTAPIAVNVTVAVDDTLYPAPTRAPGWTTDYVPYVVTPVRPLVRDLRNSNDTSVDAAAYFAEALQVSLRSLVSARTDLVAAVRYSGRLASPPGARELARFQGNTSGAALRWMLLVSDNDVAEMLFRNNAIAAKRTPSWASARANAQLTLAKLGVDIRGWALVDGSGVSRNDRLTARGLITMLRIAASPAHPALAPLRSMLPVAGVSGTLKARNGRFTTKPTSCARGKVFAKTGTLRDTIGLAGYARGSDGRLKAFAVLVNDPSGRYSKLTVRRAVDAIAASVTGCY